MGKEYIKVYINSVDIIWIVDMLGIRNPLHSCLVINTLQIICQGFTK